MLVCIAAALDLGRYTLLDKQGTREREGRNNNYDDVELTGEPKNPISLYTCCHTIFN